MEGGHSYRMIPVDAETWSRFHELVAEIVETHDTKNRDYADSKADPLRNFRECEGFAVPAWLGVLTRMSDKWMRIKNLARRRVTTGQGPAVTDEGIKDTLRDLSVYALICIELLEQQEAQEERDARDAELAERLTQAGPAYASTLNALGYDRDDNGVVR